MSVNDHDEDYDASTGESDYPEANQFEDGVHEVTITLMRCSNEDFINIEMQTSKGQDAEVVLFFGTAQAGEISAKNLKRINNLCGLQIRPSEIASGQQFRDCYKGMKFKAEKKTSKKGDRVYANWTFKEFLGQGQVVNSDQEGIDLDQDDPFAPKDMAKTREPELDDDNPFKGDV